MFCYSIWYDKIRNPGTGILDNPWNDQSRINITEDPVHAYRDVSLFFFFFVSFVFVLFCSFLLFVCLFFLKTKFLSPYASGPQLNIVYI